MRILGRQSIWLLRIESASVVNKGVQGGWIQWRLASTAAKSPKLTIGGRDYETDEWTNTPSTIIASVNRKLHLQPNHPISITRQIIESRFPTYQHHNNLFPVVTTHQNFDSLGFPPDHPGRSRTDTYYVNRTTVLRTHTSAHQADTFRANTSPGFLISADVYRRDAVDRSHYPIFHQMEGAHMWDRSKVPPGTSLAQQIWADVEKLPKHDIAVEDPNPPFHDERNPLQGEHHSAEEATAIAAHLKRSLENVVVEIFSKAKEAATAAAVAGASSGQAVEAEEPLKIRWVEAYFPFTSPSWELEVWWQGDWLEVLGCGVVKQDLLINAGVPNQLGWAFGIGLERIAMLLFSIPDIRLFWSKDPRFLSQFTEAGGESTTPSEAGGLITRKPIKITRFAPFSKYPECYKDVSFWLPTSSPNPSPTSPSISSPLEMKDSVHENDIMELVRSEAGDTVEDVRCIDSFTNKKGRKSLCYRINYRSLERTLTNEEANEMHERIRGRLVKELGVELR